MMIHPCRADPIYEADMEPSVFRGAVEPDCDLTVDEGLSHDAIANSIGNMTKGEMQKSQSPRSQTSAVFYQDTISSQYLIAVF